MGIRILDKLKKGLNGAVFVMASENLTKSPVLRGQKSQTGLLKVQFLNVSGIQASGIRIVS